MAHTGSRWDRKKIHPGIFITWSRATSRKAFVVRMRMPGYIYEKVFKTYGEAIQKRYELLDQRPGIQNRSRRHVLEPLRHKEHVRKRRKKAWLARGIMVPVDAQNVSHGSNQ